MYPSHPSLFSPNGDWTWVQHIDLNFSNKCIKFTPCQHTQHSLQAALLKKMCYAWTAVSSTPSTCLCWTRISSSPRCKPCAHTWRERCRPTRQARVTVTCIQRATGSTIKSMSLACYSSTHPGVLLNDTTLPPKHIYQRQEHRHMSTLGRIKLPTASVTLVYESQYVTMV